MSDDIVKELRESKIALHSTAHKAADEIEKLREELDACDEKTKELCDEITCIHAEFATVTAERDRLQILHDEAYIAGMKHGWNCCATGDEARYKISIENLKARRRNQEREMSGTDCIRELTTY